MSKDQAVSRRAFLAAAGAIGTVGVTSCTDQGRGVPQPAVSTSAPTSTPVPVRQTAILAPAPRSTVLVSYDVDAADRSALGVALRAADRPLPGVAVTISVGASLFDGRYHLKPPRLLTKMPAFRGDVLDERYCHGDLLVQASADDAVSLRAVTGRPIPNLRERWRIEGFHPPNLGSGVRNLFGFREGAGNPDTTDSALMDRLVWIQRQDDEPDWCVGGTYQVVRLIRMAVSTWASDSKEEQERVFGRSKETGAPLGQTTEEAVPDFINDPDGRVTPLDAHIRRANPRTPESEPNRILRRGYSYRRTPEVAGTDDVGQIFVCFQRNLERGFVTIQHRLSGEALERYTLTFGGGYFFALPAVGGERDDYLGRIMLES